jgi:hypothetical protein
VPTKEVKGRSKDEGWGVVVGRFMQPPPEPKAEEQHTDDVEEHDADEHGKQ